MIVRVTLKFSCGIEIAIVKKNIKLYKHILAFDLVSKQVIGLFLHNF
jgi:hypothetical protein